MQESTNELMQMKSLGEGDLKKMKSDLLGGSGAVKSEGRASQDADSEIKIPPGECRSDNFDSEFERASLDAEAKEINRNESQGPTQASSAPVLATQEKTECYARFDSYPVRIEGPEYSCDYTYFLVDRN